MRLKALAEIYTMHSFCTVLESEVEKSMGKRKLAQQKPWKSGKFDEKNKKTEIENSIAKKCWGFWLKF